MKRFLGFLLLLVVAVFTLQNYEVVEIRFLLWSFTMSRAIVFFLALLVGVLIGLLIRLNLKSRPPQGGS